MVDLKIPKLNKKADKYLFKKKLTLRRKSKRKLLGESFFMLILSTFLFYIFYLIPNKEEFVKSFFVNLEKLLVSIIDVFYNSFQVFIVIFFDLIILFAVLLILGGLYRLIKVVRRKSKQISYD